MPSSDGMSATGRHGLSVSVCSQLALGLLQAFHHFVELAHRRVLRKSVHNQLALP